MLVFEPGSGSLCLYVAATFIVQFLFLTLLVGIPLFTLHACLGQCLGAGVIDMWHISPIFHVSCVCVCVCVCATWSVILSCVFN